jgi:acetyltransferase-like isoleucine patch superfamily enzyme
MSALPKEAKILKTLPVVIFSKLILKLWALFERGASKCKSAAIFPNANHLACHWSVEIKYPDNITLGTGVVIGKMVTIGALGGITLGNNVRISKGATIESASLDFSTPAPYKHNSKPIVIGNDVWIGSGAIILAGVSLGDGTIVGAGTVVSKSLPSKSVCVGSPCRVLTK